MEPDLSVVVVVVVVDVIDVTQIDQSALLKWFKSKLSWIRNWSVKVWLSL